MAIPQLTPSLPEYLTEFCKATLTFESADEILYDVTIQMKALSLYFHMVLFSLSKF